MPTLRKSTTQKRKLKGKTNTKELLQASAIKSSQTQFRKSAQNATARKRELKITYNKDE